jgi:Ran GTPase-activating protein (RanGAP) involved in mRNA processing and transport
MSGSGLDDRVADKLGTMLAVNASIEYLDLSDNCIGDMGAWPLAMGLAANTSLAQLDLRRNHLSAEGRALLTVYGSKALLS